MQMDNKLIHFAGFQFGVWNPQKRKYSHLGHVHYSIVHTVRTMVDVDVNVLSTPTGQAGLLLQTTDIIGTSSVDFNWFESSRRSSRQPTSSLDKLAT